MVTGVGLLAGTAELLLALGRASLPLGLLCVGAALQINSLGRNVLPIAYASAIKFLVLPALAIAGCLLTGLEGPPSGVIVLFLALPTASWAYVTAQALGGDSSVMASTVTVQTIAGVFYLPGLLFVLTSFTG